MSIEENKAIIRRYVEETWNNNHPAVIEELLSPDFVQHNRGVPPGREGVKQFFAMLHAAFPDIHNTIEDMIAEGDKVVWRSSIRGTHQGLFQKIPGTGKPVIITATNIVRMANGQIIENWGEVDNLGLLQQLGVLPTPGQAVG